MPFTKETAKEYGARGGRASTKKAQDPYVRIRNRLARKVDEGVRLLMVVAGLEKPKTPDEEAWAATLKGETRYAALLKCLEYGLGRPATQKMVEGPQPEETPDEPSGLQMS